MAAAVAPQPPYPTPSISRNSTGSSLGGHPLSQSSGIPTDAARSIVASPLETPAPKGQHHYMSFQVGSYAPANGMHTPQGGPRAYADLNGQAQQQYPPGHKPSIYTAVYSGVSVYEMEVNRVSVMRRRSDSWLNATQILKVAGVEKGKRTKVLEKEILSGEHEKVQGGYGKYQGTWINYKRGREFCRQYGVEELLRPLLEYDMGQDGVSLAGQGSVETPTKEQAMAAQRKRMMYSGNLENRPPASSPNGTFFKNISATAANAVQAINKARFQSPGPRPGSGNRRPTPGRRPSQQMGSQESQFQGSSQQSMQSLHSEAGFGNGPLEPAFGSQNSGFYPAKRSRPGSDISESPRKRARPSSSQDPFSQSNGYNSSMRETTPTEFNESFGYPQPHSHQAVEHAVKGLPPLPQPNSPSAEAKQQQLVSLFLDPSLTDFSNHPTLQCLAGEDLDIPMDQTAHTALHWAATLAKTSLLRSLIAKGASIFRVNGGGETALIRAALTTNNLDHSSFPELLELLGPTIEMRDGRGRTVLHHIAVSSAMKGKGAACRYYLESLLEFVVHQGSASNSQVPSFHDGRAAGPKARYKPIGLARFMSEIVNAQDMAGDTALNLAARIGNKGIIQQLLEVGANPTIPNRGGLKPVDFGVGGEPEATEAQTSGRPGPEKPTANKVSDTSRSLMASFSTLIADHESSFRSELQSKQSLIDAANAKLRETTTLLHEERRTLSELERRASHRADLEQQMANLRRANEEQKALLALLATQAGPNGDTGVRPDVSIGDADAGLAVDVSQLPARGAAGLTAAQAAYVGGLPPAEILQARLTAYRANNAGLQRQRAGLDGRSMGLEKQLRRVVALCTGIAEGRIDKVIGALVMAVQSEGGAEVDVGRVREFLRMVEGGGGE